MNTNLRYLAASRVDTPVGALRDAIVLSPTEERLGTLNGILVDPAERRLCYFVVESGRWPSRREHLVPAGFARMEPKGKALYLDVEPERFGQCEECRSDRLPEFSDEDLISAMFATQHAN
jgi:PRC-barrel domain protein